MGINKNSKRYRITLTETQLKLVLRSLTYYGLSMMRYGGSKGTISRKISPLFNRTIGSIKKQRDAKEKIND